MKKAELIFSLSMTLLTAAHCGGDGTEPPPLTVGSSVVSPSVSKLVAEDSGGGFIAQPPPGSTCLSGAKKFTLTVATRSMDWTRCTGGGTMPFHDVTGNRVLSDTEYKNLQPLFDKLQVVKPDGACTADASTLYITITTPGGTQQYVDTGSQCQVTDKPLIDRGAVFPLIDQLNTLSTTTAG